MGMMLSEPAIVPDIFASGLAEAEMLPDGMNVRLTFYATQRSTYDGASHDNIVVARVIMPLTAVPIAISQTLRATGRRCCGGEKLEGIGLH